MNSPRDTFFGAIAAAALLFVAVACGGGSTTTVSAPPPPPPAPPPSAQSATGQQTITFAGATFQVPSPWPVYDLTASPRRCVRFDQHAVYKGHQAADAACPARVLGKTEAVQVEPDDPFTQARVLPSAAAAPVNGLPVAYEPGSAASHQIVATFPSLGIVMRVSFGSDVSTARQIVASVRKSGV